MLRRTAAYAGVSIVAVGAATVFAASPAEADEVDLNESTAAEIEEHLTDLETERDNADETLADLRSQLTDAEAVVDSAAADFGSSGAQLDQVRLAVEAADEDLGARMSELVGFAREQSDRFDEAEAAADEAAALETRIGQTEAAIAELDDQIDEAEDAAEAAAEAEAEAQARAAEEAAEATETESDSGSGDSSPPAESSSESSSSPSYSSDAASAAVEFAHDQLGDPYVFGAAGPDSWDCSGLVQGAYAVSDVSLPHSTFEIWDQTSSIDRSDLRAGDLVFYSGLGHMAIYIGDGEVIHAPSSGDVVKIADVDMMSPEGFRRV